MIPKNKSAIEKEYNRCMKKRAFVHIPKELYTEYIKEAYSDMASAEKEAETSPKWAIVKAYQALFLATSAVLIKKAGFYSKDHGCVLIALLNENVISKDVLNRISSALKSKKKTEDFFDEVSNIRVARNKYLYLPKTQRNLSVTVPDILDEIRELINILGDIE